MAQTAKAKKSPIENNIQNLPVSKPADYKPKVTKESNLADVIFKYPQVAEILTDYGLHCVGCFASTFDSIKDASVIHNMSEEEIDEMVDRVNEVIDNGE